MGRLRRLERLSLAPSFGSLKEVANLRRPIIRPPGKSPFTLAASQFYNPHFPPTIPLCFTLSRPKLTLPGPKDRTRTNSQGLFEENADKRRQTTRQP